MVFHDAYNLVVVFCIYSDLVHNLKAGLFTHGLDFTYQLTNKTFLDQFRSQIGIQNNCDIVVLILFRSFPYFGPTVRICGLKL